MPLWFEIAALVLLICIAVSAIDICFLLASLNRNICVMGSRLETAMGNKTR